MAHITRKEIKQPDTFQTYAARAFEWLQARAKGLMTGAAVVLALAALIVGYRFWTERVAREASLAFALAESAGKNGKGAEMEESLRKTALAFPKTRGGVLARLHLADLLRGRGAHQAAEAEYRILLASGAALPADRELAQRGLAASLAAQEKCPEAVPLWQEILAKGTIFPPENLYLSIASCHEKDGKPAEALRTLEELSQKFPRSPFLDELVRDLMGRLAGKKS